MDQHTHTPKNWPNVIAKLDNSYNMDKILHFHQLAKDAVVKDGLLIYLCHSAEENLGGSADQRGRDLT